MIRLSNLGKMPTTNKLVPISRRQYFFTANGFRPRKQIVGSKPLGQRCATFEAGENKSGHISAGANEGIFFFESENRSTNIMSFPLVLTLLQISSPSGFNG
jgi:hypothetical protein